MYKTLIVVDRFSALLGKNNAHIISFEQYLRDYPKLNEPRIRIINLCDTGKYLSEGYYCSLLAEGRRHHVIPCIKTINDMRGGIDLPANTRWLSRREMDTLATLSPADEVLVCLGKAGHPKFQALGNKLFRHYPSPVLTVRYLARENHLRVERGTIHHLDAEQQDFFIGELLGGSGHWLSGSANKAYRWKMAILVNPEERTPPSNKGALARFVRAARKLGMRAELVTANELLDINQYDALFIRETTAIDHHTYTLACVAENSGVVVLDDPSSILRCCNKVYLHDAFQYQNVPSPLTEIVDHHASEEKLNALERIFRYPMVLKMPESSFSQGVFKVRNRTELRERLDHLLHFSALALAQEYLYTEFDWRVGVLNGRAIYACRYYMAPGHWQIYNHDSKRHFSGGYDSLPTFEVPKPILDVALRACKAVGNGLYGVDIKVAENRPYVMEVNDNPNIDHKVEDGYIGEELYMQVMAEFLRRLELRGR
uniref:Glutathione synthase/RimK-type ligase, ATP-grasp superfamily n=1 Tax=Candidatus Kentrum sp. DK TaxID=2126562 RepID=A0A450TMK4_9GAMM|nr:MAG: Glutathione synthase/RimK-type ligase, ATP-grasp superfamily [Candidatus Kentron sp. DK]VFJ68961.1 MAG: Glutathione synthase/RimK-type ligase, ATP-grasp superfamily [Candidatus Kentron sp. DK]